MADWTAKQLRERALAALTKAGEVYTFPERTSILCEGILCALLASDEQQSAAPHRRRPAA